jgi:hypothetical protein
MATQGCVAGEPGDQEDAMSHQVLLGSILRLGVKGHHGLRIVVLVLIVAAIVVALVLASIIRAIAA